ncbi:MAG: DUF1553 domain-containing protein [Planctomycetaceae bacterium]
MSDFLVWVKCSRLLAWSLLAFGLGWFRMGSDVCSTEPVSVEPPPRIKPTIEMEHWAFQPLLPGSLPDHAGDLGSRGPIDLFVQREISRNHLRVSPAADRATWLRRVTLDLTGLPPTPAELLDFLGDDSPDAFERVVDRLLASPRYGIRWARHWLDVARYADARDLIQLPAESDFREIWRYRDWVVQAHNSDLPYDQFLRMQLAGDLLQPSDPNEIDSDALVATGFLALADFVPGDVDKNQMIADYVNDQVDVLGRAMLGLTLGCARCHDHKYDPVSIEDYYALAGIFFSTRLIPSPVKGNTPLVRAPLWPATRIAEIGRHAEENQQRLLRLPGMISALEEQAWLDGVVSQVESDTAAGLLAAWSASAARAAFDRLTIEEAAARWSLSPLLVRFWLRQLDLAEAGESLRDFALAPDSSLARDQIEALAPKLVKGVRGQLTGRLPVSGRSPLLRFRANDRRLEVTAQQQVTRWYDRGGDPQPAILATEIPGPVRHVEEFAGRQRPVIRFNGQSLLKVAQRVPEVGSLFVVFRPDTAGEGGQRLLGWEDSAVGRHGLGLMISPQGAVHVIVRNQGGAGDVMIPPPEGPGPQLLSLTWGPEGVRVYRNRTEVGINKGLTAVSPDPGIVELTLGGPGSGSAPRFRGDLCELRVYGTQVDDESRKRIEDELHREWLDPAAFTSPESPDPEASLADELLSSDSPYWVSSSERARLLSASQAQQVTTLQEELARRRAWKKPETPQAVVVQDGGPAETPHAGFGDAHVYLRGQWKTPGPKVSRGVPRVFTAEPLVIGSGSGRRELAEWVTDAHNPLTARVLVNRLWQHHFGAGLVRTSTNFGLRGDRPSHPELLDYLAAELIRSGWSAKSLQRAMVLSDTYCRSSLPTAETAQMDPENRWLAHMPRRALEAEALRDSLLAVAGELDEAPGGPGVLEVSQPRRSLYLMSVRTGAKASEFCPLFDGPTGGGVIEQRSQSIVAPQALFLMNDPFLTRLTERLSARLRSEVPGEALVERLNWLYRRLFGRLPNQDEISIARDLLQGDPTVQGWDRLCRVIVCTNEFFYVD